MKLTSEKAKILLEEAKKTTKNDGWIRHCLCVGNTAATIAKGLNLPNPEYARALGYVHDIGKYIDEENVEWHDINGYNYLLEIGIDEEDAFVCLYAFLYQW